MMRGKRAIVLTLLTAMIGCVGWSPNVEAATNILRGKQKMTEPVVTIETNKGTIVVQLYMKDAPVTAGNFLDLVKRGFYNGLTFHRYEPNFVIQGGDPKGTGTGGFVDPATGKERRIALEVKPNLKHDAAGVVAMARSSEPNSASSQFYITLAPASFLDQKYAVFGKVINGLEVAQQLRVGDKMTKVTAEEPAVK
jgi:peptidyl-prolyl cis-trans isomerase B (cyclophilin B)